MHSGQIPIVHSRGRRTSPSLLMSPTVPYPIYYHHKLNISRYLIMLPVLLSVITKALVTGDNCFGGVETFEKIAITNFMPSTVPLVGVLLQQDNVALTRDCINLCKQQQRCTVFSLDYRQFRCTSYGDSSRRHREHLETSKTSNLFEKVCLKGISKQEFDHVCGNDRLWAFERVKDTFIEGFVEKELTNMVDREECAKACLIETAFICRSADFDEVKRICRLSKENRLTQPQAFVNVKNSQRDYLENQCAPSGPASCIYMTKSNVNVYSMDSLQFATSSEDCQLQCDRETSFNCRSYGFLNNRCMLSADDEKTIGKNPLTPLKGAVFGEKTCVAELCNNGIFTYEKITGHVLRSAITTPVELPNYSSIGVTNWCRESCDMAQLNCPSFTVNYQNSRCERLDRNTQGRTTDLIAREGESYFEKICLRVPQIMSQCQDKFWAFERVLGYELAPVLYVKALNFVQSRRDCEEYCLQEREFPCRSALYNDETTECKLSPDDRRTSPGHYYRSRSIKINYLENQCVRVHSACPYVRTADSYPTYTDIVETNSVSSSEACEKMCNDNRHFLCRSYAFYASNSQCFLSGDDSISAGSSFSQKRSSIMYYERQCSKLSTLNTTQPSNFYPGSTTDDHRSTSKDGLENFNNSERGNENMPNTPSTSPRPDIDAGNLNKEVVIVNGTVGGIITTRITRFPETLLPTLPPQPSYTHSNPIGADNYISHPNIASTDTSNSPLGASPYGNILTDHRPSQNTSTVPKEGHRFPFNLSPNTKCAPNARFLFEKVTSFEPIGGHLTLLYTDLQNPGIVTECAKRCEHSALCRAFVVDYYHQTCHGLFENSSVGSLDLRLSMGKDYFEGFCVPNYVHCDKFWPFDRIIDQVTAGVRPEEIVRFISRAECRTRCLEERKFRCLSASYNSFTHECHLYTQDRNSGSLSLSFNKGIDFMENQCMIDVKSCRYHAIERDISIVSVTKSLRGTSTFHCEQACDYEKEFNCRSYTYLDNPDGSIAPGGNLCLLSSDNRATSHQGSMQFRPRALYAEKDCIFQKRVEPRVFGNNPLPVPSHVYGYQPITSRDDNSITTPQHGSGTMPETSNGGNDPSMSTRGGSSQSIPPFDPRPIVHSSTNLNSPAVSNSPPNVNARNMLDEDGYRGPLHEPGYNNNPYNSSQQHPIRSEGQEDITQMQHIPPRCGTTDYTFEKTFGYDLRYARRNRAPISARPGVVNYCKEECIRMGERCLAYVIEYGPNQQQNCYFLEEAASEHRNQLSRVSGVTYNERICLREKTCDSIWTFERVIGYTLDEPANKEFKSIILKSSCQDLCLAEKSFPCRSITYDYGRRICRLFSETRRSKPGSFKLTSDYIDYFDNKCAKELSTCQYRDFPERYFNYVDRILIASSLTDCQRQCDAEQTFHCKSVNFDSISRECSLSSEDLMSFVTIDSHMSPSTMDTSVATFQQDSIFSEKGNCEQVSVQCNQQDMMLTLNFDSPFYGRIYTKSNPSQCFVNGNGQSQVQFAIPLNSRCGTHQESSSNYVNEVIVQQHSVIMTDSDRTIRVLCSFEVSDQTITLGNVEQSSISQSPTGIDVSANLNGRSYHDSKLQSTVVTNTAAPPSIIMRILDHTGHDAQVVSLGDDLKLRIELKDQKGSAFAMFARNLYARSSNGESLFLIDNNGCPVDPSVFPALKLDPSDNRSLYSKFKAFRFPTTGVVNFEVQIRFCQEYCEPNKCSQSNGHVNSFGRRRRSINSTEAEASSLEYKPNEFANSSTDDGLTSEVLLNGTSSFNNHLPSVNTPNNSSLNPQMKPFNQSASVEGLDSGRSIIVNPTINQTAQYARTRSHKTGFTYPSTNYRYFRNRDLKLNQSFHEVNTKLISSGVFIERSNMENKDLVKHNNLHLASNGNEFNNVDSNKLTDTTSDQTGNWYNQDLFTPPSNGYRHHHNDKWHLNADVGRHLNIISDGVSNNNNEISNNINSHSNAVLPLPTTATEVPLSLAIMVDDNDEVRDQMDGDIQSNEFDDQAVSYGSSVNLDMPNDYRYNLNYADMARIETRNDIRLNDKKNKESACSSECSNTGIVIFITTLIVTVIHLTLATTVYLYMSKLKKLTKQKRMHSTFVNNSRLNSMTPSSSSSISSFGKDDSFSIGDDALTASSNYTGNFATATEMKNSSSYSPSEIMRQFDNEPQKPQKWFGINNDHPPMVPNQQCGSIRSAFNRENVFFGPKEQRFFGINNYAFPSNTRHKTQE